MPGSLVSYDPRTGQALTIDYALEQVSSGTDDCYSQLGLAEVWFSAGTCHGIRRTLNLVQIENDHARRLYSTPLPPAYDLSRPLVADGRVFLFLRLPTGVTLDDADPKLLVVDGLGTGTLQMREVPNVGSYYGVAASHDWVVTGGDYHQRQVMLVDANAAQVVRTEALAYGYTHGLTIVGDHAVVALGEWGAQAVSLASP